MPDIRQGPAAVAGDDPVGFVMLSRNVPPGRPGIMGPYFLWRLLIDEHYQRRGLGREVLTQIDDGEIVLRLPLSDQ